MTPRFKHCNCPSGHRHSDEALACISDTVTVPQQPAQVYDRSGCWWGNFSVAYVVKGKWRDCGHKHKTADRAADCAEQKNTAHVNRLIKAVS